jgi:hypothetical protein
MFIAYAQNVITPSLERPVYLAGFGHNRQAVDVHDDLYVRALALRSSGRTLVLCSLDLIGFIRQQVLEVIQRVHARTSGPDRLEILIASVHPHHGPDTLGLWGPDDRTSGVDPRYMTDLKEKITATILAALEHLQPAAGMKATSVHVPGVAKNVRNPEIVDDELTVLQFLDESGQVLASLFDFPCHPEVLWEHNTHITADYPGVLRREMEQATAAPCIFFSGALGGMMTPDVRDHSFEEAEMLGRTLAQKGLEALGGAESLPLRAISLQKREIQVKLTNPLYKLAFRRKLLSDVRDRKGFVHTEVNLLQVGGLWFAAVPGELLPGLGLHLKTRMLAAGASVAAVIGLANDELGYMLPAKDFHFPLNPFKPGKHYEETNSIGRSIGPVVVEAVETLLMADRP